MHQTIIGARSGTMARGAAGDSPTVTVLIPALNESENLPFVLPAIPEWVNEVILVDGDSTDGTDKISRELMPDIRVVNQEGKGKGAALRSGFSVATGDIVVTLDADGSMDPSEIPAFVGALTSGAELAKGSRFVQGGGTVDMTPLRKLGNWCLVILVNHLFHVRYSDITYGYNAVWRVHADVLALDIDGWACEIISNIRAARHGLRVVEVASFEQVRLAGQPKLRTFSAGWMILKGILAERFKPHRKRESGQFLYDLRGRAVAIGWPVRAFHRTDGSG